MIYELAVVACSEVSDDKVNVVTEMIKDVITKSKGDILVQDDWGIKTFAQPTKKGVEKGKYFYYIYQSCTTCNEEIARRLKIDEDILKSLFVKLGEDDSQEKIVKNLKTPFSKKYHGSVTDEKDENSRDVEKDRKRFARKRTCWFRAKGIEPTWKDPATFSWLVNEFGKISPARVSGVSRKYQRLVTNEIKRARQIGITSYLNSNIAR